jgi:hypothetical protein
VASCCHRKQFADIEQGVLPRPELGCALSQGLPMVFSDVGVGAFGPRRWARRLLSGGPHRHPGPEPQRLPGPAASRPDAATWLVARTCRRQAFEAAAQSDPSTQPPRSDKATVRGSSPWRRIRAHVGPLRIAGRMHRGRVTQGTPIRCPTALLAHPAPRILASSEVASKDRRRRRAAT